MSRPESVSSRIASFGSSIAIWKISLRFFSPPEKPTLTGRERNFWSIFRAPSFSFACLRNSMASSSVSPRSLRRTLTADFRNTEVETPGISIGYWKARKMPARALSSGVMARRSLPSNMTSPSVTS